MILFPLCFLASPRLLPLLLLGLVVGVCVCLLSRILKRSGGRGVFFFFFLIQKSSSCLNEIELTDYD